MFNVPLLLLLFGIGGFLNVTSSSTSSLSSTSVSSFPLPLFTNIKAIIIHIIFQNTMVRGEGPNFWGDGGWDGLLFFSFKLNISKISLLVFPFELSFKFQDKTGFSISMHKNLLEVKDLAGIYKETVLPLFYGIVSKSPLYSQVTLILCLVSEHVFFTAHIHIFWGNFQHASFLFSLINTLEKVSHHFLFFLYSFLIY